MDAPFQDPALAAANVMIDEAVDEYIEYYVWAMTANAIKTTVDEQTRVTSKQLAELRRVIAGGIEPGEFQRTHQELLEAGRETTLNVFRGQRGRHRSVRGYRAGAADPYGRYAGGRLAQALESNELWVATPRGIKLKVSTLTRRAKQWARLNFGAGPEGIGSLGRERVHVGAMTLAAIGFDEPARPAMMFPGGYFMNAAGQALEPGMRSNPYQFVPRGSINNKSQTKFYVNADGQRRQVQMIGPRYTSYEGEQFLDKGLHRIALEMGPAYQALYRRLWEKGKVTVRPYRLSSTVTTK